MIAFSEPCPQCGGTGLLPVDFETSPEVPYRCPACHSGMVPDDGTVEALAKGYAGDATWAYMSDRLRKFHIAWSTRALVAAARYQSERGGG